MDITWYTPQSLHNSSCCGLAFVTSEAGAGAIAMVDEDTIGIDKVDPFVVIDEDTIGVDEIDPIAAVDEDTIGVDEVDPIVAVDEDTIGVDDVDPIIAVDEDTIGVDDVSTPTRLAGARVEGRKVPYLLT